MKNMKKLIALLLAMSLLGLAACAKSNSTPKAETTQPAASAEAAAQAEQTKAEEEVDQNDRLTQIQAKGELVIGMEGNWAPWTYHDESDKLVGFDVEVGQMIAEKLGVKATFVEGEWDGLLAGVKSGRYDMVINGVDVTEDRAEAYLFSSPYAYIATVLVVAADNDSIQTPEDLAGKTTANSIGSTYMEIAESYGATVMGVDTLDETIELLLQGRVDATLNADQSILDYLTQHPDAPIKMVCAVGEANAIAIPMSHGGDAGTLAAAVNEALYDLRGSGALAEASMKYFGVDITEPSVG